MPDYNGPAQWAMNQQNRQDETLRNILNLIMATKQQNVAQDWKQREFQNTLQQQNISNAFNEKQLTANTGLRQAGIDEQLARLNEQLGYHKDLLTDADQRMRDAVARGGATEQLGRDRLRFDMSKEATDAAQKASREKDNSIISTAISVFNREIARLERQSDDIMKSPANKYKLQEDSAALEPIMAPLKSQIANLSGARAEVAAFSGQPLSPEGKTKITSYLNNLSKVKSGEIFETPGQGGAQPPATGMLDIRSPWLTNFTPSPKVGTTPTPTTQGKTIYGKDGAEYRLSPDGKVYDLQGNEVRYLGGKYVRIK